MGDPGNPTDPGTTPEPDPEQPGWASPNPPPPPPIPAPEPDPVPQPEPAPPGPLPPPEPAPQPQPYPQPTAQPAWGTPPPTWGAPPPGGPVPPGGAGWTLGPPPKKRRLTWLWFLIPVLAVFVVSFVVVIVFAVKLVTGPIEATNDYYADISAGRYGEAYDDLCQPAQDQVSRNEFIARQRSDEQTLGRITDYDFSDTDFNDGDDDFQSDLIDAITSGTVERGGSEYDARATLRKEDGDWKVCGIAER